jgi:hypothetical protein
MPERSDLPIELGRQPARAPGRIELDRLLKQPMESVSFLDLDCSTWRCATGLIAVGKASHGCRP